MVIDNPHRTARQFDADQGPQRDLAHAFEPVRQGPIDRARLGDRIAVLKHEFDVRGQRLVAALDRVLDGIADAHATGKSGNVTP